MIKIVKDKNEKLVTKGAYEEYYKHLGYDIVNKKEKPFERKVEENREEVNEDKEEKDKVRKESYSRK